MNAPTGAAASADALPWTCPFCALLCDGFAVVAEGDRLALVGSDCPRARAGLAQFQATPLAAASVPPRIGAQPVALDAALDEAARRLAASRQPLFGALATDVDGARALYPLACATGAIVDAAGGEALMQTLRALQDRGNFTTTLAEVRNRADLIVCIGSSPAERYPELWRRVGIGEALVEQREIVFLGAPVNPALESLPCTRVRSVALPGDLFDGVAQLAALVNERRIDATPELAALAAALRAARYAVLVVETSKLPAHGALIMESLNAVVAALNRHTRAATLPLGGNDGLAAVNSTIAWLSGLPLRSRAGPLGLEHEPLRFGAERLLAEGSVDTLLWIASFGPEPAVPATTTLPTVVLGHPGTRVPDGAVFIPVATPGIASPGHLVRTDSSVTVPLVALKQDALPTVAEVLRLLTARVRAIGVPS